MSQGFAVFILMNNYFHDVATAMLLACAIAMRAVLQPLEQAQDASSLAYFSNLARGINKVAWFSAAWILLSGIPRVLTFTTFEWPHAVEKHHEAGLIVKYVVAVTMMIAGAYLWYAFFKKIRSIIIGHSGLDPESSVFP